LRIANSEEIAEGDDGYGWRLLAEAVPEIASGEWALLACVVTEVRKQRGKRIMTCALDYVPDGNGEARTDQLLVKIYGSDRGRPGYEALRELWRAGFRPPRALRVPRPYGYSGSHGALVQERVGGQPWADALRPGPRSLRLSSVRAADWLVRLQLSGVEAPDRGYEDRFFAVGRFVDELAELSPAHDRVLRRLADTLEPLLGEPARPLVPSHGDFHPKNVLIGGRATTVIDFDTFGLREPAFDVGYAIGQLLVMSFLRLGDPSRGVEASQAFWDRYVARGGAAGWDRTAVHVARTLLQSLHYELCTLRTGRVELLRLWPQLAGSWLVSERPVEA